MLRDNTDNRRRAFAEVVTLEVWHKPLGAKRKTVALQAHVVFGTARLGGEAVSPVRFKLSLKRAEIVAIVPEAEPVSVAVDSVARAIHNVKAKKTTKSKVKKGASLDACGEAGISSTEAKAKAKASIAVTSRGGGSVDREEVIETSQIIQLILVTDRKTPDGFHKWDVSALGDGALEGSPWDANVTVHTPSGSYRCDEANAVVV